jgi:hypothetical protein
MAAILPDWLGSAHVSTTDRGTNASEMLVGSI